MDKIWYFTDFANKEGGASVVAIDDLIKLKKNGENVFLISNYGPVDKGLIDHKIPVFNLFEKRSNYYSPFFNIKLFMFLNNNKNLFGDKDIFHVHTWTKGLSLSLYYFFFRKKRKIIITLHDYFTFCPNGAYYNFQSDRVCNLKPMSLRCFLSSCDSRNYLIKLYRFIYLFIYQFIYKRNKNLVSNIFISKFQQKIINKYDCRINSTIIGNQIKIFNSNTQINRDKNKSYIYLGRLTKDKGVLDIAKAAKLLKLNIIFIGDGPLRDEIINIYSDAKITGWIDQDLMKEYFNEARVGFLSSKWYEPFGLSAFEMMSQGIPLIISKETYAGELLIHKKNCIKFDFYNDDIINAIKTSFDNEMIRKLSINCLDFSQEFIKKSNNHKTKLIKFYNLKG